jgi:hypothetical protein
MGQLARNVHAFLDTLYYYIIAQYMYFYGCTIVWHVSLFLFGTEE